MLRTMALCGAMLLAAGAASAQATVTLDQVTGATTAEELLALGAHRVGAAEFDRVVAGRTMDEGSWTWTINADGTQSSRANDGSWADSGGTWDFAGDQYCRQVDGGSRTCSDVYMIGGYMRMTGEGGGALAGWTVKVP